MNKYQRIALSIFASGVLAFSGSGCTILSDLTAHQSNQRNARLTIANPDKARLILFRPRENLLQIGDPNPMALYQGDHKIADIPHGQFIALETSSMPKALTLHWFNVKQPTISKTVRLDIQLQQGESQTVKLEVDNNQLQAELMDDTQAAAQLPWLTQHKL